MKFEFVGTNIYGDITTYFTPNSNALFDLLNGNKFQKEVIQLPKVKPK